MKVSSLLIHSWKVCTITTDKVADESLLFLLDSINNGLWSTPDFLHSVLILGSSSHTGHVLLVYVWVHFSLHNPRNHQSCQKQLSGHHQNEFWIQIQRWHLMWSYTFWLVFPIFLSWGTVAFPGWRESMTICFCLSSLLIMNFLVWLVTVLSMMAADLQAAREEKQDGNF